MDKIKKILNILTIVMVVITLVIFGLFLFGGNVPNQLYTTPVYTGTLLTWCYILGVIAIILALIFPLINLFTRPKQAVKSFIGFDMKPEAGFVNVTKTDLPEPVVINGITYIGKIVVECNKQIEFTTLDEIRKQHFPNVSGDVVYMINTFFVTKDAQSYKLDKNFIDRCELLQSSEFDIFKDKMQFSIIRIFTKAEPRPVILR